jgi:hypothetical protein
MKGILIMFTIGQKCICKIGQNQVEATIVETSPQGPWLLKTTKSGKIIKICDGSRITPLAGQESREGAAIPQEQAPAANQASGAVVSSKNKYSLLDAAEIILKTCPHQPLSAKAIIKLAAEDGIWKPGAGKTPANTLHASINKEIKVKGEASRFRRSSEVRGAFLLAAYY